jgi:hypothetical protein
MNSVVRSLGAALCLLAAGIPMWAQDGCRGHWSGSVEVPQHSLGMEVDLDKATAGWVGAISIPAQNATGIPLDSISFVDGKCVFRIKNVPGEPTFKGSLSADGKTMSGDFVQGTGSFPFKFTRTGDAKIEPEKSSPPVAKEFLGSWEGALEAGQTLRLVLKISNEGGASKAVLLSLDQGGVEIPVTSIDQKESKLTLVVKMVGGGYDASINKEGTELSGTWTQAGNSLPLKLTKAGAATKKP